MINSISQKTVFEKAKNRVSLFRVLSIICFFVSAVFFIHMWLYGTVPNFPKFFNKETVLGSIYLQSVLFLCGIIFYVFSDKISIVFKVNLTSSLQKKVKQRYTGQYHERTYNQFLKKRLIMFVFFEIFFMAFFILSLIITRIMSGNISNDILNGSTFFQNDLIFFIYAIVGLIAVAIDILHVNFLITLYFKSKRKKKEVFVKYDHD